MGAISGRAYLDRIDRLNNEIWLDGKKVEGPISHHPVFKGLLQEKAALYDLQLAPEHKPYMTYPSPDSGDPIGLSYMQPKSKENLIIRRKMMELWAKKTFGMMGRSPDYLNTVLMSFASSAGFLEGKENCFPQNLVAFYKLARENDLSFTHTFISPQINRSQLYIENSNEPIALKVVDVLDGGIVVKGARLLATQGGLTDEVLVFSVGRFLFNEDEAFAFSIPSNTNGVKFICRDTFTGGTSRFDHPLSSRYEEMDCLVVFDHVLVPWDRVFYFNNGEVAEQFIKQSCFHAFAKHQVITRQIAKTEFVLGIAQLLIDTINIGEYQHIQEKVSEIIVGLETMRALQEKAENSASPDQYGIMRPDINPLNVASVLFPKMYPRFTEILQIIGASGMITLPTENAFNSSIRKDLDLYLQGATRSAEDRVKVFRLAWDVTMSSFGTRETQYERYFFGDPVRLAGNLYKDFPIQPYADAVSDYLQLKKR
ncbi:4-hydroxyphenylacetate 3-monooxygenase [Bhargavaea ginsengi]|uniref:4-hydroxyphenylacetate 3-monooxygenase n=1 Tax=Bhargavaea ginsengi TaxID=426757 RepID=A0A1H7CH57_9BACL|nr:4-hydroxyphenylacetate 3-monooxygenase, oxygenase component [Bhargavaea ginsengi]SEJ85960.1 4-hydroxyphenylacetate 3-monooxygenase [Bhargavaea ginsengi]